MGARLYDAHAGRFITPDSLLTEHPYIYCDGDPVNHVDPSGHQQTGGFSPGEEEPRNQLLYPPVTLRADGPRPYLPGIITPLPKGSDAWKPFHPRDPNPLPGTRFQFGGWQFGIEVPGLNGSRWGFGSKYDWQLGRGFVGIGATLWDGARTFDVRAGGRF